MGELKCWICVVYYRKINKESQCVGKYIHSISENLLVTNFSGFLVYSINLETSKCPAVIFWFSKEVIEPYNRFLIRRQRRSLITWSLAEHMHDHILSSSCYPPRVHALPPNIWTQKPLKVNKLWHEMTDRRHLPGSFVHLSVSRWNYSRRQKARHQPTFLLT